MRQRCRCQSEAGIARFKNGARITSGPEQLDGLAGHAIVDVELDRQLVAVVGELDVQALRTGC